MGYSKRDLKNWLSIAKEASLGAGKFLAQINKRNRKVELETTRDIKITADRQSEKIIINFLKRESPFPILSEEKGLSREGENKGGLIWIVDPLDGSLNTYRGIPISCISIGLWQGKKPLLGVIYDFNKSEMYLGIASIGAWLNGRRIKVSKIKHRARAILLTGFPSLTDFSQKALFSFVNNIRSYKKIRLLGSAALSLAYVASGRADAYLEEDIMLWDIAGGIPLVMGAGGKCFIKESPHQNTLLIYASNKFLAIND